MKNRTIRKAAGELAIELRNTAGAVRRMSEEEAKRGPNKSHAVPIATLAKTAPDTAAIPAFPMSVAVRFRLSLMIGRSGGAAKVDTKHEKNDIHERWKARM